MTHLTLDRATKLNHVSLTDSLVAVFDQRPDAWLVRRLQSLGAQPGEHARTAPSYRLFRSNCEEGFRVVHDLRSGSALDCQLWTLTATPLDELRRGLPERQALTPVHLVDGRRALGAIEVPSHRDAELLGWWQPSLAC